MRVPLATYRLQFGPDFPFARARDVLPYLVELGVSDVYASPIFKARSGSSHGYDVVDYDQVNPELGGRAGLDRILARASDLGLGWVQDFVPNHMAFHPENRMLRDVLERGPASSFRGFFDIDWDIPDDGLKGRVLVPFLTGFYGTSLEAGEVRLTFDEEGLGVLASGLRFPLRLESYAEVLVPDPVVLENAPQGPSRILSANGPELSGSGRHARDEIRRVLAEAALEGAAEEGQEGERRPTFKARLWALSRNDAAVQALIDDVLRRINGTPGDAASFDALDAVLERQHFRLSFWKVAAEEVNYRRFFGLNDLIGLRLENPGVFERTHALLLELLETGKVTGLRLDHIDGLYHPQEYLDRLRGEAGDSFIVVEKILGPDESLPSDWTIQGTTGYDWLNMVNGVLCRTENAARLESVYASFTGRRSSPAELQVQKKRLSIGQNLAGDVANLARLIKRISGLHRRTRDFTAFGLRRALVEILAQFPVYRIYPRPGRISEEEEARLRDAVWKAKAAMPALLNELDFILDILLLRIPPGLSDEGRDQCLDFAMRFQQFLAPVAAKGFEDTFLYVYNRLLSLNEVGGDPSRLGRTRDEFHAFNARRGEAWPGSLNATSTHDAKRGEDVRARLAVLSEIPEEWRGVVNSWRRVNRKHKRRVNGRLAPDPNDEYFLYQSLAGAFPFDEAGRSLFQDRVKSYMIKAVREAKVHTAWLKPDEEYEKAVEGFVDDILSETSGRAFLEAFLPFARRLAFYGILNSLSQTLLKITSPGVPDFYQGAELWDLAFVDPDNRRPVDYERRRAMLRDIRAGSRREATRLIADLWKSREDGRLKLFLIWRALAARRARHELFRRGNYLPLEVEGRSGSNVIAFARRMGAEWAITVSPRFPASLVQPEMLPLGEGVWGDTRVVLPPDAPASWVEAIAGRKLASKGELLVSDVLMSFPVALLLGTARRTRA